MVHDQTPRVFSHLVSYQDFLVNFLAIFQRELVGWQGFIKTPQLIPIPSSVYQ